MDYAEFERLVLRVLFETNVAITAPHVAYLGGVSVKTAERYLARMVEDGTLLVRANTQGQIEYFFPGRKPLVAPAPGPAPDDAADASPAADPAAAPLLIEALRRPPASPLTAVMLSMLIPGAGHIYNGRAGAGVAWMATTLAGYACCFLPGLFLHGLCLVSAANARQS